MSEAIRSLIRTIPDFPKPGILFRDITPLLASPQGFGATIDLLAAACPPDVRTVVAVESRGFIFGSALALRLRAGFVPVRKPGKLPRAANRETYELEYGTDSLEMHADAMAPGARAVVVDDLLATGGTARAACRLVERGGASVAAVLFVIELPALNGRAKLAAYDVRSLIPF